MKCKTCKYANIVTDPNTCKADIINNAICDITPAGKTSIKCEHTGDRTISLDDDMTCTAYEKCI